MVDDTTLPKAKRTSLGLYVTAAQAYEMWKTTPDKVKIIDVRTPEEFAFVGHPGDGLERTGRLRELPRRQVTYAPQMNAAFVAQVKEIAQPADVLLVTCRSGGRGAMAVNQLAAAGFAQAYNIVDEWRSTRGRSRESLPRKKDEERLRKNSAPSVYGVDPEKIILEGGCSFPVSWPRQQVTTMAATPPVHPIAGGSRKMKRTLDAGNALRTVASVVASAPTLIASLLRRKTSAALRER